MKTFLSSLLQALLQKHPVLTPFVLAFFLLGVGIGSLSARSLDSSLLGQAQDLFHQPNSNVLFQSLLHTALPLLLLFFFAWSAIGTPFGLTIILFRGFSVGFLICFAVRQWQTQGILFALSVLFPRMLVEAPALLLFCIFSCGISNGLFGAVLQRNGQSIRPLPYLLLFLALLLVETLSGCGFEYLQQFFFNQVLG
ncbi:MAG: stage II sporulation protein M [Clostridia bacterium]|nr:stage II sporulation protein M [Clostridia bacterium]